MYNRTYYAHSRYTLFTLHLFDLFGPEILNYLGQSTDLIFGYEIKQNCSIFAKFKTNQHKKCQMLLKFCQSG